MWNRLGLFFASGANQGDQDAEIGVPVEIVTRKIRQDGDERGMIVFGYTPVFPPVVNSSPR